MATEKSVDTIVLDSGAIIRNEPSVSTLVSRAENIVTAPAIVSEIKDAATRSRVETTLKPFLTIRSPTPASIKFVSDFARRTGDLPVLSRPDIQIIALTYEIECELNGGDWRLRRVPGQKGLNGRLPAKGAELESSPLDQTPVEDSAMANNTQGGAGSSPENDFENTDTGKLAPTPDDEAATLATKLEDTSLNHELPDQQPAIVVDSAQNSGVSQDDSDSDSSDGWITPSNLQRKQAEDDSGRSTAATASTPETIRVAVVTTDHAMQNVILQMNLHLLSTSLSRVRHVRAHVLRCHACFCVSRDTSRQFCPRCGQPTLTRVACSTNASGAFRLHLRKNYQWNTRGDRYSVPKPVHGSANGRVQGGGKGGWGNGLILAEDQKEYQHAVRREKREKERSLMDDDFLPGILTGERGTSGGRVKVGAGRNVNARKR